MRFAHPEIRLLLLLLPVLVVLFALAARRRSRVLAALGDAPLLSRLTRRSPRGILFVRRVLALSAVGLLVLAAARPQSALDWVNVEQTGIDLVVALDVSESMAARDLKPSRIVRAKQDVKDLLARLEGDRVALVVFAGEAVVYSPLTVDHGAIRLMLDAVEPGMLETPGTALAEALERAVRCFEAGDESQARAVLLVTDGESHEGDLDRAVRELRGAGVRVFALGVGRPEGEPIPLDGEAGGLTYKSDRDGRVVMTRLDEATLQRIAIETGGAYVPAAGGVAAVDHVARLVRDMEEKAFEAGLYKLYEDRYVAFLLPALVCLLLELVFEGLAWRRARALPGALALSLLVPAAGAEPAWPEPAREAAEAYRAGDYVTARTGYETALASGEIRPEILYNLGIARFRTAGGDSARLARTLADFRRAATTGDGPLRRDALYNAANTEFTRGNLAGAEGLYKDVLRGDPTDEDARYNLELVQRLLESQEGESPREGGDQEDEGESDEKREEPSDPGETGQEPGEPEGAPPGEDDADAGGGPEDAPPPDEKPEPEGGEAPAGGDAGEREPAEPSEPEGRIAPEDARRQLDKLEEAERDLLRQLLRAKRRRVDVEKDW